MIIPNVWELLLILICLSRFVAMSFIIVYLENLYVITHMCLGRHHIGSQLSVASFVQSSCVSWELASALATSTVKSASFNGNLTIGVARLSLCGCATISVRYQNNCFNNEVLKQETCCAFEVRVLWWFPWASCLNCSRKTHAPASWRCDRPR